jgi:hypothetical protein
MCQSKANGGRRCYGALVTSPPGRAAVKTIETVHGPSATYIFVDALKKQRALTPNVTDDELITTATVTALRTSTVIDIILEDDIDIAHVVNEILAGENHTHEILTAADDNYHTAGVAGITLHDPITPLPTSLTVGDPWGEMIVLAGGEVKNGTATLYAYKTPSGELQLMLHTDVHDDMEHVIMARLATKTHPVKTYTEEQIVGQVEIDTKLNIFEDITTAAVSVNHHLKGDGVLPQHTAERVNKLHDLMLHETPAIGDEQKMWAAYRAQIVALKDRVDNWDVRKENSAGSKLPILEKHVTEMTVTKEHVEYVSVNPEGLTVKAIKAGRLHITHEDGQSSLVAFNQTSGNLNGSMYEIELPNGAGVAHYVPPTRMGNDQQSIVGMRGELRIFPKNGNPADPAGLVKHLETFGLSSTLATGSDVEWVYLKENIFALGLTDKPEIQKALQTCEMIEGTHTHQRLSDALPGADISTPEALRKLMHDAETAGRMSSLQQRVGVLRDAVAKITGKINGEALLSDPKYKPLPGLTSSTVRWRRLSHSTNDLETMFEGQRLSHGPSTGYEGLEEIMRSGFLRSQSDRVRAGIGLGGLVSGDHDLGVSDGARGVYLSKFETGEKLNWSGKGGAWLEFDPAPIVSRTDSYGHNGDAYGAGKYSSFNAEGKNAYTPEGMAALTVSNMNEILCSGAIDMYGPDAPLKVHAGYGKTDQMLKAIEDARGLSPDDLHPFLGIPMNQWVVT